MKRKSLKILGITALVAILALNLQFAYSNYGLQTSRLAGKGAVAFFDGSISVVDESGTDSDSGDASLCQTYCQTNVNYNCIIYIGGVKKATCKSMHSKPH
ncbi:MAG: hypothetical protein J0H74_16845 [Chitinophagaceae bacterium]|nr:hypothetical protein [Chitinophagaceae bacterium]